MIRFGSPVQLVINGMEMRTSDTRPTTASLQLQWGPWGRQSQGQSNVHYWLSSSHKPYVKHLMHLDQKCRLRDFCGLFPKVYPLTLALEFSPPTGKKRYKKWMSTNIAPDQGHIPRENDPLPLLAWDNPGVIINKTPLSHPYPAVDETICGYLTSNS